MFIKEFKPQPRVFDSSYSKLLTISKQNFMTTERLFAKNCVFKSQNNCDTRELQKKKRKKRNENNTQYYDND